MKLLVTGGAGFIGSNFIKYFLNKYNYKIICLDLLTYAGNLDNLKSVINHRNFKFIKGDVRDKQIVNKLLRKVDVVIHFAAETHVDRSILYSDAFLTTDVYGTYVLLEAARRADNLSKFIYISTDEVYGEAPQNGCCDENAPLNPASPYAASKAAADRLCYSYYVTYKLPIIITRCTNNYGPNQYPEKLIPLFITNALEDKELPLYGDGKNIREWIYVDDHVTALELLLHHEVDLKGEVINIGTSCEVTNLEIAKKILKMLNKKEELIKFIEDRPGHIRRHAIDSSKIRKLGWRATVDFDEGLDKTITWYKNNKWWWYRIKKSRTYHQFHKLWYEKRLHKKS